MFKSPASEEQGGFLNFSLLRFFSHRRSPSAPVWPTARIGLRNRRKSKASGGHGWAWRLCLSSFAAALSELFVGATPLLSGAILHVKHALSEPLLLATL